MKEKKEIVNVESATNNGLTLGVNNGTVYNGMNYTEIRALCLDLIKDEIAKAKLVAKVEAERRDNELISKIFEKLGQAQIPEQIIKNAFEEPAMQFDFIEAEKAYIKYGSTELCDILSNIIVDRISEKDHSLLQIALGEAIKTVPLLLPTQMATLSLRFLMCHTINNNVNSHIAFANYLRNTIVPIFESGTSKKESEFQHLSYTRCAEISAFTNSLSDIISGTYGGLFSKGFDKNNIPNTNEGDSFLTKYPNLFIMCLNDNTKYQINAINIEALNKALLQIDISSSEKSKIVNLYNNHRMTDEQIKQKTITLCPDMEELFKYWNSSSIANLNLTSVGIVIGGFFASAKTHEKYNLKIWI